MDGRRSVGRRALRRALWGLIAVVGCAALSAVAAAQSDERHGRGPGADAPAAHQLWVAEREARRASPAERERRQQSRSAYAGQGDTAALATARETHRPLIEQPVWRPVPHDARVETFLSDHSARVEIGGRTSFLDSLVPLRVRNDADEKTLVDLSLVARAGGFDLRNPIVPVALPDIAGGAFAFERSGVRLRHLVEQPAARATEVEGRLHFANVDADTDLVALPRPNGVETFVVLRSAQSPEEAVIELDVPDGAELRTHARAAGAVQVVRGDEVLFSMLPPVAWDADHEAFPVTFEASGSRVLVRFAHRERDLRYPLVVDPFSTEGFYDTGASLGAWGRRQTPGKSNWQFQDNVCGGCLFTNTLGSSSYADYDWAEWFYVPHGTAYAWRLDAYSGFENGGLAGGMYQGLQHPQTAWWKAHWHDSLGGRDQKGPAYTYFGHENYLQRHSLSSNLQPPVTTNNHQYNGTQAVLGLYMPFAARFPGNIVQANFHNLAVFVDDADSPTIELPSGQPTGWVKDGLIDAPSRATDGGLGVKEFQIWAPAIGGGSQVIDPRRHSCDGTWPTGGSKRCPASWGPGDAGYTPLRYSVDAMPEGVNTLTMRSFDLSAHPSPAASWTVKVDRTRPDVELGGFLYESAHEPLTGDAYDLWVDATDEASGSQRAGVRSIEVWVNRVSQRSNGGYVEQSCPEASCPLELSWDFRRSDFGSGVHSVEVVVRDWAGNETAHAFTVDMQASGTSDPPDSESAPSSPARRGAGPGCAGGAAAIDASHAISVTDGLRPDGFETTIRYADDSYYVARCDAFGKVVKAQHVGPVETPDGTRLMVLAEQAPVSGPLGPETEVTYLTYLDAADPEFVRVWPLYKDAMLADTMPPTSDPLSP